jgi:putative salt-induced outer membrane protein
MEGGKMGVSVGQATAAALRSFNIVISIQTIQEDAVRSSMAVCVVSILLAVPGWADQVTLKNGDRLTGTISKSDGKELVIKTDYAGDVTVKFDAIQGISSTGDLHVAMSGGKTAVGPVTTSGDNIIVATRASGAVEAPRTSVTALRSPAEQAAYEKSLHPGLAEGWTGGLNVGFALTRGNSQTKNLNTAFTAVRKGAHDKLGLYANSIFASNDLEGVDPHTTANTIGGGARYDHDFTPRAFAFVNADFYHDELQTLDLRSIFGGGIGLHAIKSDTTTLDLLAGVNYTHESYSVAFNPAVSDDRSRSLAGLTLGDEFMHKLGKSTVLTQNLYFYPDLTNTGEYRGTFSFGTVTKINKWLGWQNSFVDVYVSQVPPGKKQNDIQLSTGLAFSFVH